MLFQTQIRSNSRCVWCFCLQGARINKVGALFSILWGLFHSCVGSRRGVWGRSDTKFITVADKDGVYGCNQTRASPTDENTCVYASLERCLPSAGYCKEECELGNRKWWSSRKKEWDFCQMLLKELYATKPHNQLTGVSLKSSLLGPGKPGKPSSPSSSITRPDIWKGLSSPSTNTGTDYKSMDQQNPYPIHSSLKWHNSTSQQGGLSPADTQISADAKPLPLRAKPNPSCMWR